MSMSKTKRRLVPEYRKRNKAEVDTLIFNPDSANPGEKLYIRVPRLTISDCLIPESLHLCFDLKVSNTKSYCKVVWRLNMPAKLYMCNIMSVSKYIRGHR